MQTLIEALGGAFGAGVGRPTGSRVHRDTRTLQGREGGFWQPFDKKRNAARYMQAAERYEWTGRLAHRRARTRRENGPLGHVGLEVLRELLRMVNPKNGQLDPAIATIAARIGRSIAAVAAALQRLKAHGFLDWLRRYVPTGQEGLRGPQVKQTSNAYRLTLPASLTRGLDAPMPDDELSRQAEAAEAVELMLSRLSNRERIEATWDDSPLARVLASLGASLDRAERDSGTENESYPS